MKEVLSKKRHILQMQLQDRSTKTKRADQKQLKQAKRPST